jgi:hypothetical protein
MVLEKADTLAAGACPVPFEAGEAALVQPLGPPRPRRTVQELRVRDHQRAKENGGD